MKDKEWISRWILKYVSPMLVTNVIKIVDIYKFVNVTSGWTTLLKKGARRVSSYALIHADIRLRLQNLIETCKPYNGVAHIAPLSLGEFSGRRRTRLRCRVRVRGLRERGCPWVLRTQGVRIKGSSFGA